ncbi:MAG: EamA family transporter [Chloroflexaceae bacterium]|nr:EamA family transporter [Chloroflexaceae bacterium]
MLGLLLGLSSSLCWGTADFFGGLQARRLPALTVAMWSQLTGGLILLLVLLVSGTTPTTGSFVWGMVAGVCGALAITTFYQGLAIGIMSIVSPIAAAGVVVPVVGSLLLGEVPGPLVGVGLLLTIGGIVLVSLQTGPPAEQHVRPTRNHIVLALAAALGFGLFLWL